MITARKEYKNEMTADRALRRIAKRGDMILTGESHAVSHPVTLSRVGNSLILKSNYFTSVGSMGWWIDTPPTGWVVLADIEH